jgi:hypothetical protein
MKISEEKSDENSTTVVFNENDYKKAEKAFLKLVLKSKGKSTSTILSVQMDDYDYGNLNILQPINIDNLHWVLCDIDLSKESFNILDSYKDMRRSIIDSLMIILKKLERFFKEFKSRNSKDYKNSKKPRRSERIIYNRMKSSSNSKKEDDLSENKWMILYEECPQQLNGSDCGVMIIKFNDMLSINKSVYHILPEHCFFYRIEIGLRILEKHGYLNDLTKIK